MVNLFDMKLQEARALLGRYEYQKGNIEAALHVFEGIDIATVTPKIKISLSKTGETRKKRSHNYATPPLSPHALSLLVEAIYLKSKSLQILGRYKGILFILYSDFQECKYRSFSYKNVVLITLNIFYIILV